MTKEEAQKIADSLVFSIFYTEQTENSEFNFYLSTYIDIQIVKVHVIKFEGENLNRVHYIVDLPSPDDVWFSREWGNCILSRVYGEIAGMGMPVMEKLYGVILFLDFYKGSIKTKHKLKNGKLWK